MLTDAGLRRIRLERCDVGLDLAAGGGLDSAVQTALAVGPAGRAIAGQSPDATEAAIVAVRKALARYVRGQSVSVPSSFWIATAVDP